MEALEQLQARENIRSVINRYCMEADRGQLDGVAALFSEDAVYEFGSRTYLGRSGIREMFVESGRHAAVAAVSGPFLHSVSTSLVELSGSTAQATTYVTVLSGAGIDHWGRYHDDLAIVDGKEWLITRRRFTLLGAVAGGIGEALR
ncbi:nuclear transport factor 2 family protein [Mycobacterium sherrisii]|nr:nuclear transport factor 2 family protein [Mycobacterium sherrisii]MCV7032341.1 nuclear transport factor 2 family protein [Mycobacterium sherrisii]